jgi:ankyrin repeat protein
MACGDIKRLNWILKQKNVQINLKDSNSETPLMIGVAKGNVDLVEELMNNFNCDINLKNDKGAKKN